MSEPTPEGWVLTQLRDVIHLRTGPFGSALHQSDYIEGGTPLVNPMHIVGGRVAPSADMTVSAQMAAKLSEYRLQPGDVVLGRRGEMGRCAVISEREQGWLCGTGSLIVRPLQRALVPEYLQLLLTSRQVVDYLMAASVGSTMANLNQQHLLDMEVLLPPVAAQTRIVSKIEELLSDLDAGVAELKAAQKKLQQYRQSLLKAAVEGSLTAAWREAHPAPEETGADLLAHILRERRARWEAQQLAKFKAQGKAPPKGWQGKYPEPASTLTPPLSPLPGGWTWATVDQISAGRWYGTSAKTSGDSSGVPVLRMGNIQDGELDVQSLKYLPQDHDEFPNLLLTNGTMLFNRTNSPELVGKAAIYRSELSPCSFASYLIGVQFVSAVNPEFVAAYINSIFGRTWIKSVVTQQTGQANVNGSKLAALAVPLPPAAEQEQIAVLLTTQRAFAAERLKDVELSLRQSTAQRQNLLRAAFAGQLVPQDPADEPAAELLARIRAERSQVPSKLRKARSAAKESR